MRALTAALPLTIGFIIDFFLGDPYSLPHPIRLIGKLISALETRIRKYMKKNDTTGGIILAVTVVFLSSVTPLLVLSLCYRLNTAAGVTAESIMCYYLIAAKCLKDESMKVYSCLKEDNVEGARKAVSMIVGRDTNSLDKQGIIRAAVETVAENTSDGVTAPMFFMMIGGAAGGFFYKSVNTLDSMIGYKNEKYRDFGRFAAKFDDVLNYIPSRITAVMMIFASFLLNLDGKNAFKIWRRDRRNHSSPNSAQTEAVCAGALGVVLGGDAFYLGKLVKKKTIGDPLREIENEDIKRSDRLMYLTSLMMLIISCLVRYLIVLTVVK